MTGNAKRAAPRDILPAARSGTSTRGGLGNLDKAAQSTLYPASFRNPLGIKKPSQELTNTLANGTLIVGKGVRFKGTLDGCDTVIVQGLIRSTFKTQSLLVLEGGECAGTVETENADVAGKFDGELAVRDRLKVRSKGRLSGTFHYARISIDEGAEISGYMEVGGCLPPPMKWQKSKLRSSESQQPAAPVAPPEIAQMGLADERTESLPSFRGPKYFKASLIHKNSSENRTEPESLIFKRGET